jgi:hypothetical protein
MSNVSAREVFKLTAAAFKTSVREMATRRQGRGDPMPSNARDCAVMLARRHTAATYADLAEILGWTSKAAPTRLRKRAAKFEGVCFSDMIHRITVDIIEENIDRLHEARAEAIEKATRSGFAGLASQMLAPKRKARRRAGVEAT